MKDINFLKKESVLESLSKRKSSKNLIASIFAISAAAVIGVFLCLFIYNTFLNFRINSLNKEIETYGEVVSIQNESAKLNNSVNSLSRLVDKSNAIIKKSDTIKMIGEKCPEGIAISSYEIDENGALKLSGMGSDKEIVIGFTETLRTSGYFKSVELRNCGLISENTNVNAEGGGAPAVSRYNFNIEIVQ